MRALWRVASLKKEKKKKKGRGLAGTLTRAESRETESGIEGVIGFDNWIFVVAAVISVSVSY